MGALRNNDLQVQNERTNNRAGPKGPALLFDLRASASPRFVEALLDVACGRTAEHRFVCIEGVLDLAIEIEIVLRRLCRRLHL